MPKYSYKCTNCQEVLTKYHGFTERLSDCPLCESSDCLVRTPSSFVTEKQDDRPKKVGELVNEYIDETREELKKQKEKLTRGWSDE